MKIRYHIQAPHKKRLKIGIHGEIPNYGYCFGNFDNIKSEKLRRLLYKFMFKIGNPILNKIIGYKEGDWAIIERTK